MKRIAVIRYRGVTETGEEVFQEFDLGIITMALASRGKPFQDFLAAEREAWGNITWETDGVFTFI